jgi:hypothetical protein
MRKVRFLSLLVLMLVTALPALAGPAQQTPLPTLPVTLTVTTGADGTNDTPTIAFKMIDGTVLGSGLLDQPGDLAPGLTNVYSYTLSANFCDLTQFELAKPTLSGGDDPWEIASLSLVVDGVEVYSNSAFGSPVTAFGQRGGSWQATHAYRDRCGALAWTLVELTLTTGDNGTGDTLEFEIGGSFPGAPYIQTLDQDGDLQPLQTDTYVFIVPMEFCEMTSFQLRKPAPGVDDDWTLTQLSLSIDGTDVFFDSDIGVFNPVTASSYPPNGNWAGVAAYTDRCTGLVAPPMIDPMLEIDVDHLLPVITLSAPNIPSLANVQINADAVRGVLTPQVTPALQVLPLLVTPPPTPVPQNLPLQVTLVAPPSAALANCPGTLPSRLTVGQLGRVTPGDPNNLRAAPSLQAQLLGQIPGSGVFTVLSGPQCADGMAWWEVDYNGLRGWTVEGRGDTYWLEPAQALG